MNPTNQSPFNQDPLPEQQPVPPVQPQPMQPQFAPQSQPEQPQPVPVNQGVPQPSLEQPVPQQVPQAYQQVPEFQSQQQVTPPQATLPAAQPAKRSNFKLLIIIFGSVLLLVGAAVAALLIFTSVTQKDFSDAQQSTEKIGTAYAALVDTAGESITTKEKLSAVTSEIKEDRIRFAAAVKDVGDTKAVKYDKEAKALYADFITQYEKFDKQAAMALEAYEKILPSFLDMTSTSTSADVARIAVELKKAQPDVKDENNKTFIDKITPLFDEYAEIYAKTEAANGKYDSATVTKLYEVSDKLTDATGEWQDSVSKVASDDLKDALAKLQEYLKKKSENA